MCFGLCPSLLGTRTVQPTAEDFRKVGRVLPLHARGNTSCLWHFPPHTHINSPHFMLENKKKRKTTHHHSILATSIHQGKQQRQGNTGRKYLHMHRNSQENQLMKRQKISKSHPTLLTPHLQLQTSQDFVSTWCRCQNFLLAAIQAPRGFCSPQAEGKQAVALGSRIARMVKMPCYLLCLWSTGLAANNCHRGNDPSARGCSSCGGGEQEAGWAVEKEGL